GRRRPGVWQGLGRACGTVPGHRPHLARRRQRRRPRPTSQRGPVPVIPLHHEPRPCLSVVMPAYNEEATVAAAIDAVFASPWVAQLVVVDDCSTDGTAAILDGITDERVT